MRKTNKIYSSIVILFLFCNYPLNENAIEKPLHFVLLDVGQGLSQLFLSQQEAIVFDMGPQDSTEKWLYEYRKMGSPFIKAIVISHRDIDHSGGLCLLEPSVNWSGILITSKWEDTIFLKNQLIRWKDSINILTKAMDDTIFFNSKCFIKCLWPPQVFTENIPVSSENTNHYSLVSHLTYNNTSILLNGDIDSTVAMTLAITYKTDLHSDIVIVPHHGSNISVCPLFYQYVKPSFALLSYGKGNSYGHPSIKTLEMLALLGIEYFSTEKDGNLVWRSNGAYWSREDLLALYR